jgi:hypothetical protein
MFLRAQGDAMQLLTRCMAAISLLGRPETASTRELEDWKLNLRLTMASLTVEEQFGASLLKEYQRVLEGHEP